MPVVPREGWVGSMEGLTLTNVHAVGRRAGMRCMVPRKESQYFLAVKVSFRVALKEIKKSPSHKNGDRERKPCLQNSFFWGLITFSHDRDGAIHGSPPLGTTYFAPSSSGDHESLQF